MIYVYNKAFAQIGAVRYVSSLKVIKKCMEVGSFAFNIEYNEENRTFCEPDNFLEIRFENQVLFQGIIETCSVNKSKNLISVSGLSIEALLDWRAPYPKLTNRNVPRYPSCYYVNGDLKYYSRNMVFVNPIYPGAWGTDNSPYKSLRDCLNDIATYLYAWYGISLVIPSDIPDLPDPYPVTEITIHNKSLLEFIKMAMERLHPDHYIGVEFSYGAVRLTYKERGSCDLSSCSPGISNVVYTKTTKNRVDNVFSEWEVDAIDTIPNNLFSKSGSTGWRREEGGSMRYHFQSYVNGFSAVSGTIPMTDLYSVSAKVTQGKSSVSGNPSAGYATCTVNPKVTFRKNDASGDVISGTTIDNSTIETLREQGVTSIYVIASCGNATSGWGGDSYTYEPDSSGTKPSVAITYNIANIAATATQTYVAYVESPNADPYRTHWLDRDLHRSEEGYDNNTTESVKRSRLNVDNLGYIRPSSSTYEFALDSTLYDISLGAYVNLYDHDFNEWIYKWVSEIEYVFSGEDYTKIYSLQDRA